MAWAVRVCLGGTFDPIHAGHERLLAKAFEVGSEVFIGVSSQALAQGHRKRKVRALAERKRRLEAFLRGRRWKAIVSEITHPFGRAAEARYDGIVVSEETLARVDAINRARRRKGIRPLKVFVVPFVHAADGLPISSTRIRAGDIDAKGRRRTPLRIAIATKNDLKRRATERAFRRAFPRLRFAVRSVAVRSGVPEQPLGAQAAKGAIARARAALSAWGRAEYGVGVEAGLVRDTGLDAWLDVQYCALVDRRGVLTSGHGGGFAYPSWLTGGALTGRTVSAILGPVARDRRIGSTTGAIGYLTRHAIDRAELTEHGVLMALVPRVRPDLYTTSRPRAT